jgi:hypothetical protein
VPAGGFRREKAFAFGTELFGIAQHLLARAVFGAQYPIGDAEQWAKIVNNLAALVKELDRTFVPDIERAAGHLPSGIVPRLELIMRPLQIDLDQSKAFTTAPDFMNSSRLLGFRK